MPNETEPPCVQDWLLLVCYRVRDVVVTTFVASMVMGLELGSAAGIVAASLTFSYCYSKASQPWVLVHVCDSYSTTSSLQYV